MRRPAWLTFRRFAAFTTALTGVLIMLGVYTAATGSGLACSQQWPLCDGGVLPQTLPSFIEWFHRLVAMVTGWFILGTALWAWRGRPSRRTFAAATLAVVLLPLQISVGAVTVTLDGAIPWGYSVPVQSAHLLVALTIFTSLSVATLSAVDAGRDAPRWGHLALLVALVGVPVATLFGRAGPVLQYTPPAQALFIGTSLATFAALLGAAWWRSDRTVRALVVPALATLFVTMLLGRDLVAYTPTARVANLVLVVVTFVLVAAAAWTTRDDGADATVSESVSD